MKTIEEKRKYRREWRLKNKKKISDSNKKFRIRHPDKVREGDARRRKTEKRKEWTRKYSKERLKDPIEKLKHSIRSRTNKMYGNVPKGYERHHLNYDSPHNFILVPRLEHKKIHTLIKENKILHDKEVEQK